MATPTEEQIKLAKQLQAALEELDAARRLGLATNVELLELEKNLTQAQLAYGRSIGASDTILDDYRTTVQALTEDIKEQTKAEEERAKAFAAGEGIFESLSDSVLGLSGGFKKFAQFASGGANGLKGFGSAALNGVKSGALLQGVLLKITQELVNFGFQQDEVIAQFKAQTGAGDEFNETIRDVALANIAAGVSLEDVARAVRSLKNEFTDFTYLTQQQQEAITQTTVQLEKLGFGFATQASIIQTATQSLGMDVAEANDLLIDLASTARSLGVDIDTLGSQFAANKDFIVRFGEEGQEVFEEMAVAAKALGTELGTLVGVVDKFKTFDEAGRIVGRFNAILGGPFLNSIDMLNAAYEDPIEGIKMLRDGFDQAGKSIEDLGGAELEAFASALGLSTSETIELLGKSNEELEIQRMTQEEAAEAAKQAQSAMKQLSNAFNQMLIAGKPLIDNVIVPLIEGIGSFAGFIGGAAQELGTFIPIATAAAGLAALIGAPFTGGASLLTYAAIVGTGAAATAAITGGNAQTTTGTPIPGFNNGGTIATQQAIVHPGELLITGGQGSEVISKKDFRELIDVMKNQGQGPQQIAVYVGQEKIDDIVVSALDSTAGRNAFSPFTNG
mgnify:CR=1 FL=1|tara:strand:+ start:2035 stop:3888 length:1854 start_codon:yes stop_codon:yes gene_type:complete